MPAESLLVSAMPLKSAIDDLYDEAKKFSVTKFKRWKNNENLNNLYRKVNSVLKVKTIWQLDKNKSINLKNFYHPPKIEKIDGNVSQISKISESENLIIEGTVGQGKSIFMRYMTSQEMRRGKRIPVFYELRDIKAGESLINNLINSIEALGFSCDNELFDFYARSGKFVFFLDGFDEISSDLTSKVIIDLNNLSVKYEELQIIISSRPDSGIQFSQHFETFKILEIDPEDLPKIIKKISGDKSDSEVIIEAIKRPGQKISSLLKTPLMVTLLITSYRSENKIPEHFTEFYESLFNTLVFKHDNSKPGYNRERRSNLGNKKLEECFEAFCFSTRRSQTTSLSQRDVYKHCDESEQLSGYDFEADDFLHDITKVTCLLVQEGRQYHFVHKSVQEFFASSFISKLPDDAAKTIYSKMLDGKWANWREEINFLEEIDKIRCYENLLIPAYITAIEGHEVVDGLTTYKSLQDILKTFACIDFGDTLENDEPFALFHIERPVALANDRFRNNIIFCCLNSFESFESDNSAEDEAVKGFIGAASSIMKSTGAKRVSFIEILERLNLVDKARANIADIRLLQEKNLEEMQRQVKKKQNVKHILDI